MPAGLFLSFDGLDGTGKSTQCRRLATALKAAGVPVTHCVDPGGTALGARLRDLLLFGREYTISPRAEALLFMSSRAQLVDEVIRPALFRGEVVLSDRYLLANVVYQGHAGGLDPDDIWRVGAFSTGGLEPARTLLFDLPVELAVRRGKRDADRLESRGLMYMQQVRTGYLTEAARRPDRITVIDANSSEDVVADQVWAAVEPLLNGRRR